MDSQLAKLVSGLTMTQSSANPDRICKLTDKILLRIFNQLNHVDKLNCTLVCKKFNQIISTSDKFLNSIGLIIRSDSRRKLKFPLTRIYRNVVISCLHDNAFMIDQNVTEVFNSVKNIAMHIQELYLCQLVDRFEAEMLQLLAQCKSLTLLRVQNVMQNVNKAARHNQAAKSIKLPRLSKLEVLYKSQWLLKFIDCDKLDEFMVNGNLLDNGIDFLNNLTRCDELKLLDCCVFTEGTIEPKFKWNKLTLENHKGCSIDEYNPGPTVSFQNLLNAAGPKSQLIVKNFKELPKLLAFMMTSVADIDGLIVEIDGIDLGFICKLKRELLTAQPMKHCENLYLIDTKSDAQNVLRAGWLDFFFRLFPNIKTLTITSNLIQVLDPSTVPTIFQNVILFCIINQITADQMEKLQNLHFANLELITFKCSKTRRYQIDHEAMKKFVAINSTLKVIVKDDYEGVLGLEAN